MKTIPKKLLSFLLVAATALLMASCNGNLGSGTTTPSNSSVSTSEPSTESPFRVIKSANDNSISNVAGTEDGFFYLLSTYQKTDDPINKVKYRLNIVYTGYNTKETNYLCDKAGCAHDTESCTSFLAFYPTFFFCVGDKLFLENVHENGEESGINIYSIDIKTFERELFVNISGGRTGEYEKYGITSVAVDAGNENLYYTKFDANEKYTLAKTNLSTGESTTLHQLAQNRGLYISGTFNDNLYLVGSGEVQSYNQTSGLLSTIYATDPNRTSELGIIGNALYFSNYFESQNICRVDLATGEETLFFEPAKFIELPEHGGVSAANIIGDNLYIPCAVYLPEANSYSFNHHLNLETKELTPAVNAFYSIQAFNSIYYVVAKQGEALDDYGGLSQMSLELILIQDYNAGVENYIPLPGTSDVFL